MNLKEEGRFSSSQTNIFYEKFIHCKSITFFQYTQYFLQFIFLKTSSYSPNLLNFFILKNIELFIQTLKTIFTNFFQFINKNAF